MPGKLADASEQCAKNKNLKREDIQALQEWVEKQPHLPSNITELQLILFLVSCNYSVEMAKTTIDNFYTVRTRCPDLFTGRDPHILNTSISLICFLPMPPSAECDVIYCKITDSNPDKFNFNEQLKVYDMVVISHLIEKGTPKPVSLLVDFHNYSMAHISKLSLSSVKNYLYYVQEAWPLRIKSIHFFNVMPFLDVFMSIIRPFIKTGVMNNIHIHSKSIETLYEFIPKEAMLADYGGKADSIAVSVEKMRKRLLDYADYFKFEEEQVVDESKRLDKSKAEGELFGMNGTFKKLEID